VIVDALGNPLALSLTGGEVHDITQADALLALVEPEALLADKGYNADRFVESLTARAIKVVIPPKSNRKGVGFWGRPPAPRRCGALPRPRSGQPRHVIDRHAA
jgi:transposase